ncbi:serine carboxypeptidase [Botrytis cinerea]
MISPITAGLALFTVVNGAKITQRNIQANLEGRGVPANATGEPGKEGVCETTPGVNSYSGYIDLDANSHTFFWFFEARNDPANAPVTLWLNGGPGSDSMIGLFQGIIGPCNVTANLTTQLNPYSFSEHSNLLFLSQPLGVGFSYGSEGEGITGAYENASFAGVQGRYPITNATALDTTDLAAVAAWHVLQGFLGGLPQLDPAVNLTTKKEFNLWTESYGGHYGPAFYKYFYDRNQEIANGTIAGIHLDFNTLGVGNGIIDEYIQAPFYPEFAVNNTYGIKAYNDTVYNFAKFALNMGNGCLDQIGFCRATNLTTAVEQAICTEAENICRDTVEGVFYTYGERGAYDIRHPYDDPTPPTYFIDYLNLASTQNALGAEVYYAFQQTGDFVYPSFLEDLEYLLANDWFGGEAISLAANYTHSAEFAAAGYAPFIVDGTEYGEVRQYGNFSFLRIYEAGHEVPYYQPVASLEFFRRTLLDLDIAEGKARVASNYSSPGIASATHTEPFVALPSSTSASGTAAAGLPNW